MACPYHRGRGPPGIVASISDRRRRSETAATAQRPNRGAANEATMTAGERDLLWWFAALGGCRWGSVIISGMTYLTHPWPPGT
jgi:hypothetical protein